MIELTVRERNLLIGGGVIILLALLSLGVRSALSRFDKFQIEKNNIADVRKQIEAYGQEYNLLKDLATQVSSRSQKTDITPVIEELLNSNQLTEKAKSVNPSNSVVEKKYTKYSVSITLKEVSAEEFLKFIKSVEDYSGAFLKIDYFNSRPVLRKPGLYNCQIKVATFTRRS